MQEIDYVYEVVSVQEKPWREGFDYESFMIRAEFYKWLKQVGLTYVVQVISELVDLEEGRCDGSC